MFDTTPVQHLVIRKGILSIIIYQQITVFFIRFTNFNVIFRNIKKKSKHINISSNFVFCIHFIKCNIVFLDIKKKILTYCEISVFFIHLTTCNLSNIFTHNKFFFKIFLIITVN